MGFSLEFNEDMNVFKLMNAMGRIQQLLSKPAHCLFLTVSKTKVENDLLR